MSGQVPAEIIDAISQLASQCNGDVPGLVNGARAMAQGPFADDALLARACESAAARAAERGDRGGAWWLACAVATLRASPLATPQEDAELVVARVTNERSPAALAPLPEGARWLVAGQAEPAPTADSLELARRNAATYLERLEAELAGRSAPLRAKWESAPIDPTRAAIEEALASYGAAITRTRAALSRAIDRVVATSGDASLGQRGATALDELDDSVIPTLRARVDEVRRMFGTPAPVPAPVALLAGMDPSIVERPSFAGAAPPAFRPGSSSTSPPVAPTPSSPATPSLDDLDRAMREAFERAWASPDPTNVAGFESAVRARYERETASIPDPEQRRQALDHYVAHAMAQLQRA